MQINKNRPFSCKHFLFTSLLIFSVQIFADELTDQARLLIDNNRDSEAYDLLFPLLPDRAGSPEYDLLLGIAALESGHPTQAVFAFERVLSVEPGNSRARLELARAYYEMGENEASREEFTYAKSLPVPANVSASIEEYLTAIEERLGRAEQGRQFYSYLQGSVGYDSNVNSATDESSVALPAFGNLVFTLDNTARELDSGFYSIDGGMGFSSKVSSNTPLSVYGNANFFYRPAWDQHRFDTAAGNVQLGLRHSRENNSLLVSLQGQKYLIDGDTNRNQAGATLQWLHLASKRTQYSMFIQGLVQRFPDQSIRDLNQYTGGLGFVHLFAINAKPILYGSIYIGTDDELIDTRPDIGRSFAGIRVGGEYSIRDNIKWIAGASYQYSKYGDDDPLFLERRKDNFIFLRTGLEYTYSKHWVLTPEVSYLLNDSSLVINDFNRWQFFATARYNF